MEAYRTVSREVSARDLKPRFAEGSAMRLLGLIERYDGTTMSRIPEQWTRFAARATEIRGRIDPGMFGLHYAVSESPERFDYLTAVLVSDDAPVPPGMAERRTRARRHAVFTHVGPVSELPLHEIVKNWLPQSGYEAAGDPLFVEVYDDGFDPKTLSGKVNIWMAIRERENGV